jgi:putative phosphoribosyl transferase
MSLLIRDRASAGRELGRVLLHYRKRPDVLVLALPRGGVPVAAEVARALHAPLDVLVVRKLRVPGHEDLALGAIASGGVRVLNRDIAASVGIAESAIEAVASREEHELQLRMKAYRGARPWPEIKDLRVIIVDDGIATGATMEAAVSAIRAQSPASVIVAAPLAPIDSLKRLRRAADVVACLETPHPFGTVGSWYENFPQISDDDVRAILCERWAEEDAAEAVSGPLSVPRTDDSEAREVAARPCHAEHVTVPAGATALEGVLAVPGPASGIVVFVQGGDGRFGESNQVVADRLNAIGLATLQVNLLTRSEEQRDSGVARLRYEPGLLSGRLLRVLAWVRTHTALHGLPIGLFGVGASSAAALCAAAECGDQIAAIVLRSSRPDLASASLALVTAPTLLVVGATDDALVSLNRRATAELASVRLEIVPGASHRFDEPGKLEQVARLARSWFEEHLKTAAAVRQFVPELLNPG